METVAGAWLAYVAAATWRWERDNPRSLPRPGVYVGSALLFSLLAVVASTGGERARPVVGLFGWGLVVAQLVGGTFLPGTNGVLRPGQPASAANPAGEHSGSRVTSTVTGKAGA